MQVTASAEGVQYLTASQGGVLNSQRIQDLPVNSRNAMDFVSTQAGVNGTSFNGARNDMLNITLDGSNIQDNCTCHTDAGFPLCAGPGSRFITDVIDHKFGTGDDYGQAAFPAPILGPPKGGGCCSGSLDVVTLGDGGFVSVAFAGNAIVDGPGVDFIVFENPFDIGGNAMDPYAEPGTVAVSQDAVHWVSVKTVAGKAGLTGGTDATGDAARFTYPEAVATRGGNIYVAGSAGRGSRRAAIAASLRARPRALRRLSR